MVLNNAAKNGDSPLPNGWRWVKLDEICERNCGIRDPRLDADTPFSYVDITSVDNQRKCIVSPSVLMGKEAPSRARQVIKMGDVIVSTTRPNLNAVALVPESLDDQLCSTGFCVLRPTAMVDTAFLFSFVQTSDFVASLSNLVKGALYPAVTDKQVRSQHVPLPPFHEQKRIATILNEQLAAVEQARAATEAQLEAAKALPAAYLREVFNSPEAEKWEKKKFEEIAVLQRGFDLTARSQILGEYPVVTSSGVVGFHNEYRAAGPGVVTGRSGSVGRVHFVEKNYWPHNTALFVKDFKENEPLFVFYLLHWIGLGALGSGSGVPTLDRNNVHKVIVSSPKKEEQHVLALWLKTKIEAAHAIEQTLMSQIDTITKLPTALLRKAFRGEL